LRYYRLFWERKEIQMETHLAPTGRTDVRVFQQQVESVSGSPVMNVLLDTMAGLLVVLNEDRQIVALNHSFLKALGIDDPEKVLGLRLGESLKCEHAYKKPAGCGTTAHCSTCGSAIAMMTAINENRMDEQMCALTAIQDGAKHDISLLIKAHPITVEGHRWILVIAQDVTQQQFWANLESVFFHDINNILSILSGYGEILARDMPDKRVVRKINESIERLQNEMALQRSFSSRKDAKYIPRKSKSSTNRIKQETGLIVHQHRAASGKTIDERWPEKNIKLTTDALLVSRVLGNMIINALEASDEGETVRLTTRVKSSHITWEIWNNGFIPADIQKRVFQRHFSTKSNFGRGLGTFSMRLFGERYLKGNVSFTSSEADGTTFRFRLPRA
jgi:signal transduction histidine kinase